MKAKTFILVLLLSGLGLVQLSAQNGKNVTGSVVSSKVFSAVSIPVIDLKGAEIDILKQVEAEVHHVDHYVNGDRVWSIYNVSINAMSEKYQAELKIRKIINVDINSDETFPIFFEDHYIVKYDSGGDHYIVKSETGGDHYIVKSETAGDHYIIKLTIGENDNVELLTVEFAEHDL